MDQSRVNNRIQLSRCIAETLGALMQVDDTRIDMVCLAPNFGRSALNSKEAKGATLSDFRLHTPPPQPRHTGPYSNCFCHQLAFNTSIVVMLCRYTL